MLGCVFGAIMFLGHSGFIYQIYVFSWFLYWVKIIKQTVDQIFTLEFGLQQPNLSYKWKL